jgi:membrane associated rhomboid family serine protease
VTAPHLLSLLALLGATFLHANALHLLTNALYLGVFGQRVEPLLGPRRFLALFALGAVGSAFALMVLSPADAAVAIGSSGAVAAVIGAYVAQRPYALVALLTPRAFRVPEEIVPVALLLLWLASQLLSGLAAFASGTMSGTDGSLWAHLGGFATGLAIGPLLRLRQWRTLRA